jgi:glycosyltransferase involved in cell wall biosynthesis
MPDSLRILITTDAERTANSVAIPHAYATQIEYLQRAGNEVLLFGVDDRTSLRGILRNIKELQLEISSFEPNLVVTYYGTMVAAISRLAAKDIPLVITFRGSDLQGTSNPGWGWRLRDSLGRCLSLWAAESARRIVVNGYGLLNSLPVPVQRKTHNIPNGIDIQVFAPRPLDEARCRLDWSLGEKVILFNAGVGSGQVVKNKPLAEATLLLLRQHMPEVRLECISSLSREQVALYMNACDCLLVTSLHEGSPDLVKEALACNLPVVSVPCGDIPERLRNVSLSSIQPYRSDALASAIESVLRAGQRSNGREQLLAQGLDITSVTERVLSVYRQAVTM